MTKWDVGQIVLVVVAMIAMFFVLRWRRKGHAAFIAKFAEEEVCEHLRPALELLKSRGHRVVRVGQAREDMPLEIHVAPAFDPVKIAEELKMGEPVFVSERAVLYCKEDYCEIRPVG